MISFNKIFSSNYKSDKAIMKMHEKAAAEMDKYVGFSKPWEVSDNASEYARQLFEIKGMVQNYARHNSVHVDMFIPKEKDILNISVTRLDKKGNAINAEKLSETLSLNNGANMERNNPRMLENKDGLNYIANGKFEIENCSFITQIYQTISYLVNKLNKAN